MKGTQRRAEPIVVTQSILNFAAILLCLAVALAFRLPDLEHRPMHSDEAVQAAKTGLLFDTHTYTYDPHEFHGPTLYYFTLPALGLSLAKSYAESSEFQYRIVPALFGAGLILLLWLVRDAIGTTAMFCAGMLTAVSPAMVFYSRYYIQEMLFVFFSFALIACGWRWMRSQTWPWAVAAGACAGLLHATKETCVIVFFSVAAGLAATWFVRPKDSIAKDSAATFQSRRQWALQIFAALLTAAAVSVLFYSSFFSNARGPLDSLLTYRSYLSKSATVNPFTKHWYFYLRLLLWNRSPGAPLWSEAFIILLASIGAAHAFFRTKIERKTIHFSDTRSQECLLYQNEFARFLTVYTAMMTVVYSFISYKTPWCALGFLHGSMILAGMGAAAILRWMPNQSLKALAAISIAAGAGHLAWQTYLINGKYAFDARNPYIYEHPTTLDAPRLGKRIEELAALHPDGRKMTVMVMAPNADYWPIPWYLRKMENVGYWNAPPARLDAPVLIVSHAFDMEVGLELKRDYQHNQIGLRPGVFMWVYVDMDLWKKFVARQSGAPKK